MKFFLFVLLIAISTDVRAEDANLQRIETRYGTVEVLNRADRMDVRFRGKFVRSVDVESASLYRVTPKGQREFIIVDGWTPGLYCHHVFYLVEVYPDGKAVASDQFGTCHELQGATFRGERLQILLTEPYIPGKRASGPTSFEWKNGNAVEVSGGVSAESSDTCAAADHAAQVAGSPINPDPRAYQVSGKTRLQFLSAPDLRCKQSGVFVVAGDTVVADKRFGAYTFVHYFSPKNGSNVQGWVLSKRLVEASALQPD